MGICPNCLNTQQPILSSIQASITAAPIQQRHGWRNLLVDSLIIQKRYSATFTVLIRFDGQYLSKFEFYNSDPPEWCSDPADALWFHSHPDAEANFRLIIDRTGDPENEKLGIKSATLTVKGNELAVGEPRSLPVCRSTARDLYQPDRVPSMSG